MKSQAEEEECSNCHRVLYLRGMGLCFQCFYRPAVRKRAKEEAKAKVILKLKTPPRPLPPFPCEAMPGTEAKIQVLRQRWLDGYQLWHPDDARLGMVFA